MPWTGGYPPGGPFPPGNRPGENKGRWRKRMKDGECKMGTWNVCGLSDKVHELVREMGR